MKLSPYECKPCAGYQMGAVEKGLKLAEIEGGLAPIQINGKTINSVWGIVPGNKEIPPFAHPYPYKDRYDLQMVVIDTRAYARMGDGVLAPSNYAEYAFNGVRAALTSYGLKNGVADMAGLGDLPMAVFSRFLAERITRQLHFSPQEQMLITMVSAVWYACHFQEKPVGGEDGPFDERELQRLSLKVARATRIPADVIFDKAGALRHMESIDDYVQVLREVLDNKRAESLNTPLIYALVGGGWYGLNAKEIVGVGLEHVPTFLAMVYMSLLDRSYRNSGIAKIVQACDRSGAGKSFILNLSRLIEVLNG